MIEEAINRLVALGTEVNDLVVKKPDAEPPHVYYLHNRKTGQHERIKAAPTPRKHVVGDVDALVAAATYHEDADTPNVCWYSRKGVVLLVDDNTRRDTITLPLMLSAQMQCLQKLEASPPSMKQEEIIKLLRVQLAACLERAGNLVPILRGIKWTVGEDGTSQVQHGRASMGRKLEAQVTGMEALPEYVTLFVPIFQSGTPPFAEAIQVALEPDARTQTFQLIPLPGQIEAAIVAGEQRLGRLLAEGLKDSGAAVFYGQP